MCVATAGGGNPPRPLSPGSPLLWVPPTPAPPPPRPPDPRPRLARYMDKLALVRSMSHGDNSHGSSAHRMLTGRAPRIVGEVVPPSPEDFPHYGSMLTRVRPAPRGLPTFVSMPWTIATSS